MVLHFADGRTGLVEDRLACETDASPPCFTPGRSSLRLVTMSIPMLDSELIQRMRKLIGRRCTYLGQRCTLIEVLADDNALVLSVDESLPPIQTDLYGQASHRANEVWQIPIIGENPSQFSEELLEVLGSVRPGV